MKLDLAKYSITDIVIGTDISLGKKELEHLALCYPDLKIKSKKVNMIEFGYDYKIGGKNYYSRGLLQKIRNSKYRLTLYYSKDKLIKKISEQNSLKPLSKLLECLISVKNELTFEMNTSFSFNENFKSSISLPIKMPGGSPFNEVRGMRLVKLVEQKKLFSLIVDRPNNKDYDVSLFFTFVGTISDNLPLQIVDKAGEMIKETLYA